VAHAGLGPAKYGYKKSMDEGVEPEGVCEDSPEQLTYYRAIYNDTVQQGRLEMAQYSNTGLTRISLITDNSAIAIRDPRCRKGILEKGILEISKIVEPTVDLDFFDIGTRLGEDTADEAAMEC
jgi:hypothetical protein